MMLARLLGIREARTPENPSFNLNDPEAWDNLADAGYLSATGVRISAEKAMQVAAVWQCIQMISGTTACLPIDLYHKTPGERKRLTGKDHTSQKLVRRKSNREMAAFRFWRRIMVHLLLWNRAYAYINRDMLGRPIELLPLLPDRTGIRRRQGQLYYVTEVRQINWRGDAEQNSLNSKRRMSSHSRERWSVIR
ncbi:MAG: phage portal protein [Verrucomicrobiae bacterium]|nr:phage portal protein [Verrucomicrobiae bacterium]